MRDYFCSYWIRRISDGAIVSQSCETCDGCCCCSCCCWCWCFRHGCMLCVWVVACAPNVFWQNVVIRKPLSTFPCGALAHTRVDPTVGEANTQCTLYVLLHDSHVHPDTFEQATHTSRCTSNISVHILLHIIYGTRQSIRNSSTMGIRNQWNIAIGSNCRANVSASLFQQRPEKRHVLLLIPNDGKRISPHLHAKYEHPLGSLQHRHSQLLPNINV